MFKKQISEQQYTHKTHTKRINAFNQNKKKKKKGWEK